MALLGNHRHELEYNKKKKKNKKEEFVRPSIEVDMNEDAQL